MNEKNDVNVLEQVWFLVRWATGYVIDLALLVGAVLGATIVAIFMRKVGGINPFWIICLTGAVFSALMAGRQWTRSWYMTHILPEVWANTIRDLITQAKKEHEE